MHGRLFALPASWKALVNIFSWLIGLLLRHIFWKGNIKIDRGGNRDGLCWLDSSGPGLLCQAFVNMFFPFTILKQYELLRYTIYKNGERLQQYC
jgi:hypothetical protein